LPRSGGCPNAYTYPLDPINQYDVTGQWSVWGIVRTATTIASILSVVPVLAPVCGPIAVVGSVALAVYDGVHGDGVGVALDLLGAVTGANALAAAAKAEKAVEATEGAYKAALLAGKGKVGARVEAQLLRQGARKAVGRNWAASRLSEQALSIGMIGTGLSIAYSRAPDHGLSKFY